MSGAKGEILLLIFLIIENKISNPGYQRSNIIKKGDTLKFLL